MLVVCSNKTISGRGFTYGRLYHIGYQCELTGGGYSWVTNDKGIIVGEAKMFFKTLPDWKKHINKVNDSS